MRVQFIQHDIFRDTRIVKNKFRGVGPDVTLSVSYGPNHGLELIPIAFIYMLYQLYKVYVAPESRNLPLWRYFPINSFILLSRS